MRRTRRPPDGCSDRRRHFAVAGSDSDRVFRLPGGECVYELYRISKRANEWQPASRETGEQGKQAAMAKKKRYLRVEIARTQGELQNETADRTCGEGDKIAEFELELENLRLRRQVTDLLLDNRTRFRRLVH
jgi:hypothetical protein